MSKWICDRGRSVDMRLFPDCTWEGGAECSGLKEHSHNRGCKSSFCMRAGVHRKCREIVEVSEAQKQAVAEFLRLTN